MTPFQCCLVPRNLEQSRGSSSLWRILKISQIQALLDQFRCFSDQGIIIIIFIIIIVWVLLCLLLLWAVLRCSLSFFVVLPSFPSFLQVGSFVPSSVGWCFFASSFFGWCFWVGLLFPCLLLGGAVAFCPSPLLLFGCCFASSSGRCCVFSLLLRGAAFFPSFLEWGCFLPLFCWKVLPYLLFLWVVFWVGLLFPSLLWVVPLGLLRWVLLRFTLLFAWCCLPSLPFGGAAFSPSAVWVLLCLLLRWAVLRCSLSFLAVLPSFPSFHGWGSFLSPLLLGGAAFLPLLLRVGHLMSPSSVGWCRLASLFGWCCVWPSLLLRGAASPSPPLGGAVELSLSSSSLRWCCLASFVGWCCVIPSLFALVGSAFLPQPFWWCCFLPFCCLGAALPPPFFGRLSCVFPRPLLRGAAFLPLPWVRLLSLLLLLGGASFLLLLLWVGLLSPPLLLEGAALPSLSLGGVLGGVTFPFSSVGWCRLAWALSPFVVVGVLLRFTVLRCSLSFLAVPPSFPSFLGWGSFLSPLLLGGAVHSPFAWCWPSFSSFGWCCFLPFFLFVGAVLIASSFFGRCCVKKFPLLLRGAAFLPLLPWMGLVSLSSSAGWCSPPSRPLGGNAFPPSSVGWCCLPSPPPSGGAPFVPLFCWVVPLGLLHLWGYFSLLFCWVVPLGLPLWVVLRLALSSFAWCCLPSPPLGGAAFPLLFSWVVLLGLLRWVVLRYSLSFCVVLPSFPTFCGEVSFKKKNQKIEKKNEVKNKKQKQRETERKTKRRNKKKKEKLKSEFFLTPSRTKRSTFRVPSPSPKQNLPQKWTKKKKNRKMTKTKESDPGRGGGGRANPNPKLVSSLGRRKRGGGEG